MDKQIIVLGMHRSGTSILTKSLISLGVNMGDCIGRATISNVDGHNEDKALLNINERILNKLSSSWHSPPNRKKIEQNTQWIESQYREYLNGKPACWGAKEPRTSLFIEQLHGLLSNPYYIYVCRNESDVAHSLNVRDGIDENSARQLKRHYDDVVECFLSDKEFCKVDYSELTSEPEKVIQELASFIGVDYDELAIRHIKDTTQLKKVKVRMLKEQLVYLLGRLVKNPRGLLKKKSLIELKKITRRLIELMGINRK